MILEKPFLTFILPCLFLATGLIIASFQVSPQYHQKTQNALFNPVGTIISNDGRVDLSRFHTTYSSRLPQGHPLEISLYNFDKVQTHLGSKTVVSFLDGYEIEFSPKSLFIVEQWNPQENQGPIYINLVNGDYRVLKKGEAGSVFIVKNSMVFAPNHKPEKKRRILFVNAQTEFTHQIPSPPQSQPEPSMSAANTESSPSSLIQTLSNQYIDETIAKNRDQLVKCQTHAIRQNKKSKGQLLIGISIESRGKMKDVQILDF